MNKDFSAAFLAILAVLLTSCEQPSDSDVLMQRTGKVNHRELLEISGLQASRSYPGTLWAHNDDGAPDLWALDATGNVLSRFRLREARNRDWEDIALVPGDDGDLLVIADVGDNHARYPSVELWFVAEPDPAAGPGELSVLRRLNVVYPDGPRDVEAVAWDPVDARLLLLSKRDRPPRLYSVPFEPEVGKTDVTAGYLGSVDRFRSPTLSDSINFGDLAGWVAKPTGMDISHDGSRLAVITYRSLYLFQRSPGAGWAESLQSEPAEWRAPPGSNEEAVTFSANGRELFVIPEGASPPVYRFVFGVPEPD